MVDVKLRDTNDTNQHTNYTNKIRVFSFQFVVFACIRLPAVGR